MAKTARRSGRYTLLRLSRRVDWRFLLPDVELGHVACFGRGDPDLVESLLHFSASLVRLDAPEGRSAVDAPAYDLAVLSDPTLEEIRDAVGILHGGGWLYAEIHNPLARGFRLRRLRFARAYARALEQLGVEEVEVYWHWPDFASCEEIVPLNDAGAVRLMLARRRVYGERIKFWLGRLLVRMGLFGLLVPCASIVGRRPDDSGEDA